ncbi:MAG: hypothetical protein ACRDT4_27645, partial [Micromonosporaceae bacterium]
SMPPDPIAGRVARAGAAPPVIGGGKSPASAWISPRTILPPPRTGPVRADPRGVIGPAAPAAAYPPPRRAARDEQKSTERRKDPLTAEYLERLFQVAGLPSPVIAPPPPAKPRLAGPAIGA